MNSDRPRTSTALRMHDAVARAKALEAQLEAIRAACLKVCPSGHGSVHISTAVLWPLLNPAPSPGDAPVKGEKPEDWRTPEGRRAIYATYTWTEPRGGGR